MVQKPTYCIKEWWLLDFQGEVNGSCRWLQQIKERNGELGLHLPHCCLGRLEKKQKNVADGAIKCVMNPMDSWIKKSNITLNQQIQATSEKTCWVNTIWGCPKMVGFPNKPMGFSTNNDQHWGCEMGKPTM